MAKRKTLEDLKKDLLNLQNEIKVREDDLKLSIGGVVLSQYNISSVSDFTQNYKIVRTEKKEIVRAVRQEHD